MRGAISPLTQYVLIA